MRVLVQWVRMQDSEQDRSYASKQSSSQSVKFLQGRDDPRPSERLTLHTLQTLTSIAHQGGDLNLDTFSNLRSCTLQEPFLLGQQITSTRLGVV